MKPNYVNDIKQQAKIEQQAAEIERLKAALRGCVSIIDGDDVDIAQFADTLHKARAALEGK